MYCTKCGSEITENGKFCTVCGTPINTNEKPPEEATVTESTFYNVPQTPVEKMVNIIKSPLALAVCILTTVSTILSFDVLGLLLTIFFWTLYAKAQNNNLDIRNLRNVSGLLYAKIVINLVAAGFIALIGLLAIPFSAAIMVAVEKAPIGDLENYMKYLGSIGTGVTAALIIFVACLITAAILVAVTFLLRVPLHKFAKNLYMGLNNNEWIADNAVTVKNCLIVIAIFVGLTTLFASSSTRAFIGNAAATANYIILAMLFNKEFTK